MLARRQSGKSLQLEPVIQATQLVVFMFTVVVTPATIIVVIVTWVFYVHVASFETFYRVMVTIPVRPFSTLRVAPSISAARVIAAVHVPAEMVITVIPGP